MAYEPEDKKEGIGLGGAAVTAGTAAVAGVGTAAATTAGYGAYHLSEKLGMDGYHTVREVVDGVKDKRLKMGDTIIDGLVEKKLTPEILDQKTKLSNLVPEYDKASSLGKLRVAFNGMSTGTKVGVIATGAAAAAAVGYGAYRLVRPKKTFADAETERRSNPNRER